MSSTPQHTGRPFGGASARIQKWVTTAHTALYRVSGGRIGGNLAGLPMLLLSTWGRKTGKLRTVPLLYVYDRGEFVLVASNGGTAAHPTWYQNLSANQNVLIQVDDARLWCDARTANEGERARLWPLLVSVYPQYADYQTRTTREIPVVLLAPRDELPGHLHPPGFDAARAQSMLARMNSGE